MISRRQLGPQGNRCGWGQLWAHEIGWATAELCKVPTLVPVATPATDLHAGGKINVLPSPAMTTGLLAKGAFIYCFLPTVIAVLWENWLPFRRLCVEGSAPLLR